MATVPGALFSQFRPIDGGFDPKRACQEGTRERIIQDATAWVEQQESSETILWIHGQAGIGKSAISTSLCKRLANRNLAASFFCKRDDPELNDPLRLIDTIVHGLAERCPAYSKAVATAAKCDQETLKSMVHPDIRLRELLKKPMQTLKKLELSDPLIVLVDALDECGTSKSNCREYILEYLHDASRLVSWFKVIITSRPDHDIRQVFNLFRRRSYSIFDVHRYNASDDIRAYMEIHLDDVARRDKWPDASIDQLCARSEGSFIWATTASKFVLGVHNSLDRLDQLVGIRSTGFLDNIDALYNTVINNSLKDDSEESKTLVRRCIGAVIAASAQKPLPASVLGQLMRDHVKPHEMENTITSLSAVLYNDEDHGGIRFYYPSFADYATNPERSKEFHVDLVQRNIELTAGCLRTMRQELRFNICSLETSHRLNCKIPDLDDKINSNISEELAYSCTYWISHLVKSPQRTLIQETQQIVGGPRLLYWLEVLSLLGRTDVALQVLPRLIQWLPMEPRELVELAEDAHKFVRSFFDAISKSTPHLYISGLAFAPKASVIYRRLKPLFPNTVAVTRGQIEWWPGCMRSISHPSISCLSVSRDGRMMAVGSYDGAIRIWDLMTGKLIRDPLAAQCGHINSIAFSPTGDRIVSGSNDSTVRLWDLLTGELIFEPLTGHTDIVTSVAFSSDGTRVVSGSNDKTFRLWDVTVGKSVGKPFIAHEKPVEYVAFSPDSKQIMSVCSDGRVILWGAETGIGDLLVGDFYDHGINCAGFSPDGKRLLAATYGGTVQMWDTSSGNRIGDPLKMPESWGVGFATFSSDGRRIIASSYFNTWIWDVESGATIPSPLEAIGDARAVASSSDGEFLISTSVVSGTCTLVRVWRANISHTPTLPTGHADIVSAAVFSPDGNRIISASHENTVCTWDAKTGDLLSRFRLEHEDLAGSTPRLITISRDGNRVATRTYSGTDRIILWDTNTGRMLSSPFVTIAEFGLSNDLALSPDCTLIAASALDNKVQMLDAVTGDLVGTPLIGHSQPVRSVAFSPDGRFVVAGSCDSTILRWDAATGDVTGDRLIAHGSNSWFPECLAFSPDGTRIAAGSGYGEHNLIVWDNTSGEIVASASVERNCTIGCIAFSPSGDRIVSGTFEGAIQVWETETGRAIGGRFVGHTRGITSVSFSPDGELVLSASSDRTLRVWSARADPSVDGLLVQGSDGDSGRSFRWPCTTFGLPPHPVHLDWASHDYESLLLWVPTYYRRPYDPRAQYCISTDLSVLPVYLDFSKFVHSTAWTSIACDDVLNNQV